MWLGLLETIGGSIIGSVFKALFARWFPSEVPAPIITLKSAETVMAPVSTAKAVKAVEDKGLG